MNIFLASTVEHGAETVSMPIWAVIPFAGLLLTIGVMSFMVANFPHSRPAHLWESNRNKLIIALAWSIPVVLLFAISQEWGPFVASMEEYFSFIVLLFALFVISGGIYLEGDLRATPVINTTFLAVGAVIANLIGTTGASMLLIRPVLKTNAQRKHTSHIPVFFIFLVSNIGGCLLPIGDPPLFLGYLQGVPFFWTLNLVVEWATAIIILLVIFYIWDTRAYRRENVADLQLDRTEYQPLSFKGTMNFLWLAGVLAAVIFITPSQLHEWGMDHGPLMFVREYMMIILSGISLMVTPGSSEPRQKNNFTFGPILEVAFLFIGIFITMVPALQILKTSGPSLGVDQPWQFFWATGVLSSVLDNAPTYLTFLALAEGIATTQPGVHALLHLHGGGAVPEELLIAISLGAVFMGANTYIGNGPNFMVKAIADEWNYKTPDFFSYIIKYSLPILIPVFIVITLIFFRG